MPEPKPAPLPFARDQSGSRESQLRCGRHDFRHPQDPPIGLGLLGPCARERACTLRGPRCSKLSGTLRLHRAYAARPSSPLGAIGVVLEPPAGNVRLLWRFSELKLSGQSSYGKAVEFTLFYPVNKRRPFCACVW